MASDQSRRMWPMTTERDWERVESNVAVGSCNGWPIVGTIDDGVGGIMRAVDSVKCSSRGPNGQPCALEATHGAHEAAAVRAGLVGVVRWTGGEPCALCSGGGEIECGGEPARCPRCLGGGRSPARLEIVHEGEPAASAEYARQLAGRTAIIASRPE
jgi:hypothetical protein